MNHKSTEIKSGTGSRTTRRYRRRLTISCLATALLGILAVVAFAQSSGHTANPRYLLTANVNFPVSASVYSGPISSSSSVGCAGSRAQLFPGVPACLRYAVTNPLNVPIAVTALSVSSVTFTPSSPNPSLPPCKASDFSTTQFAPTAAADYLNVASGTTAYLGEPVTLLDDRNQDNCENGTFNFTVNGSAQYTANTQTVLAAPQTATWGQPVTLTATVTAATNVQSPPSTVPTSGSVKFYKCNDELCTTSISLGTVSVSTSGVATLSRAYYPLAGTTSYAFWASYAPPAGSTDWNASPASNTVTLPIGFNGCVGGKQNGLQVKAGQAYCVSSSGKVSQGVSVQSGGALFVQAGGQISGGLKTTGPAALYLCGGSVGGGTNISGASGPVVIGLGTSSCPGNVISNGITASNNTNGWSFVQNTVTGGSTLANDSGAVPSI